MKYLAIIKKEKDGKYSVSFPDFKGGKFGVCVSCGDTLEEAEEMAQEALQFHIDGMLKDGEELPTPSIAINIKV